jgi:hypothetical protein
MISPISMQNGVAVAGTSGVGVTAGSPGVAVIVGVGEFRGQKVGRGKGVVRGVG